MEGQFFNIVSIAAFTMDLPIVISKEEFINTGIEEWSHKRNQKAHIYRWVLCFYRFIAAIKNSPVFTTPIFSSYFSLLLFFKISRLKNACSTSTRNVYNWEKMPQQDKVQRARPVPARPDQSPVRVTAGPPGVEMIGENPGPAQPGHQWRAAVTRLRAVSCDKAGLSHNVLFTPRLASHFSSDWNTK